MSKGNFVNAFASIAVKGYVKRFVEMRRVFVA